MVKVQAVDKRFRGVLLPWDYECGWLVTPPVCWLAPTCSGAGALSLAADSAAGLGG